MVVGMCISSRDMLRISSGVKPSIRRLIAIREASLQQIDKTHSLLTYYMRLIRLMSVRGLQLPLAGKSDDHFTNWVWGKNRFSFFFYWVYRHKSWVFSPRWIHMQWVPTWGEWERISQGYYKMSSLSFAKEQWRRTAVSIQSKEGEKHYKTCITDKNLWPQVWPYLQTLVMSAPEYPSICSAILSSSTSLASSSSFRFIFRRSARPLASDQSTQTWSNTQCCNCREFGKVICWICLGMPVGSGM